MFVIPDLIRDPEFRMRRPEPWILTFVRMMAEKRAHAAAFSTAAQMRFTTSFT